MNDNLKITINYYCNNELISLKNSQYYKDIYNIATELGYSIQCYFDRPTDNDNHIYLSFQINDKHGNIVINNQLDGDCLTDATGIVVFQKPNQIKFFTWKDDRDFIDSLKWIYNCLITLNKH